MVNVRDFGACGNGENDDTAAIQAAFDTGLTVYIPEGRYRVTNTLQLKEIGTKPAFVVGSGSNGEGNRGQRVYGDGKERTIIAVDPGPFGYKSPVIEVCSDQIQLDNFAIRLEDENQQWGAGIRLNNEGPNAGRYVTIKDVYLRGLRYGIYMGEGQWCNNLTDILIEGCYYGVYSAREGNYINLTRVNIDSANIGFYLKVDDASRPRVSTFYLINLLNCRAELCKEYGVYIQGAGIINIDGCYFERNAARDIFVDVLEANNNIRQFTDKLNINNCYFSGFDVNQVGALSLDGSKHTTLNGNYFNCYRNWTTLITGVNKSEKTGGASLYMRDNVYQEVEGVVIPDNELDNVHREEDRERRILAREKHYDTIEIIVPDSSERQLLFKDADGTMAGYYFYDTRDGDLGLYDAKAPRGIFRTTLGSADLRFNKNLIPERSLDIGSPSNKWGTIYATNGVIQTSDEHQKNTIKSIVGDVDGDGKITPNDFTEFIKNTNFVTFEWKDKNTSLKGLETQVGFVAQEVCKDKVGSLIATDKEYSMTNLVMSMGVALQEALKEIEELKHKLK